MNKADIIRMAEEAGMEWSSAYTFWTCYENELTRFAELVAEAERKACADHYLAIMRDAVTEARKDERIKCERICIEGSSYECAEAIRQRGGK